jgi:hypothetical protein
MLTADELNESDVASMAALFKLNRGCRLRGSSCNLRLALESVPSIRPDNEGEAK